MRVRVLLGALLLLLACAPSAQAADASSAGRSDSTRSSGPDRLDWTAVRPHARRGGDRRRSSRRVPRRQPRRAVGSQALGVTLDTGDPWATVNVCDTPDRPAAIGIRASAPARGRASDQWLRVRVQYFSSADGQWRFVRAGGDSGWERVGRGGGTVETGYTFTFQPPSTGHRLVMRGVVDFEWRQGRRVKASAQEMTELGHADPSDPLLADSRDSCQVAR